MESELKARSISYRVVRTESLEHGIGEARKAAQAGEVPVVMSGDGLIGQIGGALAETEVPIGILPGGRGNDLARVLGIPPEPAGAVQVLADGHTKRIDVGEANGRRFLGIASFGFDSECNRIANETKLIKGNLVYAYSVPRALAAWRPATFELTIDRGEPTTFSGWSVAIANSRAFGGGMFVAPHAELDDGLFDIVTIASSIGKLRYLANLPKVFKGRHLSDDGVTELHAAGSKVVVSSDRDFAVYADGEQLTDLPATVRVLPRALTVIAPPGPLIGPPGRGGTTGPGP